MDGKTFKHSPGVADVADPALLERVQRQTFGYFWDYAHPASGMARDRGRSDGMGSGVDLTLLDPSLSQRRPRFGCFCGTFSPSRRQIR